MITAITAEQHTALSEDFQAEYEADADGGYTLKLTGTPAGFVPAADHVKVKKDRDQKRDRNDALLKDAAAILGVERVEDLSAIRERLDAVKDVDVEEFRKLKAGLKKKGIKIEDDEQDFAAILDAWGEKNVKPLQTQLAESETARKKAEASVERGSVERFFSPLLTKADVHPTATAHVLSAVHDSFHLVDGEVTVKDGKYSENGAPLTPQEWVTAAKSSAFDYCFTPSSGGGAAGSDDTDGTPAGAKTIKASETTPAFLGEHQEEINSGKLVIVDD